MGFKSPLKKHHLKGEYLDGTFSSIRASLLECAQISKELITISQIHKGCKQGHLREIQSVVGCNFEEMIFFDNEPYNCQQVAGLGREAQFFFGCFIFVTFSGLKT